MQHCVLFHVFDMLQEILLRTFVDHGTNVSGQLPRLVDRQFCHGAFQHRDGVVGDVVLYIHHA